MSATFADIVENVKHLSPAEQEELHDLLRKYLLEARRQEIGENADAALEEYKRGDLKPFSNVDDLMDSLTND